MEIPRIIHRVWLDDPMPARFAEHGERWAELHPGWEVRDWMRTVDLPPLHNAQLFERARAYTSDWKRWQADVLRLELLAQFGGVYVDVDCRPLRCLGPLLEGVRCFAGYSPNRGPGGRRLLTQAVLGSVPDHPFIRACISRMQGSVDRHRNQHIAQVTGPWHITRVYESDEWPDVTTFDEGVFYPVSIAARDRGEEVDTGEAYVTHGWNTTARKRGIGVA